MVIGKYGSLSGVLAIVLIVAGLAAAGSTPNAKASIAEVVAFYPAHQTSQTISGILVSLGALLFLVFAATFSARVAHLPGQPPGASALCLVGAGVLVVGLIVLAGLSITFGDVADDVDGSVLQTLNVLSNDAAFVFLVTIGTSAFLVGAATTVFTTHVLPQGLGWLAVVLAILGAIPSHVFGGLLDHIGFLAFAGLGVWTVLVGVLFARRPDGA